MAAYATTIYPARETLHNLLKAAAWSGNPPEVLWGPSTERDDSAWDLVHQGTPEDIDIPFPGLSQRNDEEYTLPIIVDVHQYGDDEQATEQQAWAHVNDILTLLRNNLDLQGAVNRTTGFAVSVGSQPSPNRWQTQIVVRVSVVGIVPA